MLDFGWPLLFDVKLSPEVIFGSFRHAKAYTIPWQCMANRRSPTTLAYTHTPDLRRGEFGRTAPQRVLCDIVINYMRVACVCPLIEKTVYIIANMCVCWCVCGVLAQNSASQMHAFSLRCAKRINLMVYIRHESCAVECVGVDGIRTLSHLVSRRACGATSKALAPTSTLDVDLTLCRVREREPTEPGSPSNASRTGTLRATALSNVAVPYTKYMLAPALTRMRTCAHVRERKQQTTQRSASEQLKSHARRRRLATTRAS